MKTIALRFSDNYAPKEGTIKLHQNLIEKYGYVWYGKFGNSISKEMKTILLENKDKRFLLIKSGGIDRYWIYYETVESKISDNIHIPEYYRNNTDKIGAWFKVIAIKKAENNIMGKCIITATGQVLSLASKYSMNPYFKITYNEESK
jgi:hypothetical protein